MIALKNVSVHYGKLRALHDVSLNVPAGSLVAVAGANGSGKSTLLKAIAGIIVPQQGVVSAPIDRAYLPQQAGMRRGFPFSVLQAVCTGFWCDAGNNGAITTEMRAKAKAALHEVGLLGFEKRLVSALSGGQFQRMLFARTIVQDAQTLLLDEPFAAVDGQTIKLLLQLVHEWHREGRTVVCVLHDLVLIKKYFPSTILLNGTCVAHDQTENMFSRNLLSLEQGGAL